MRNPRSGFFGRRRSGTYLVATAGVLAGLLVAVPAGIPAAGATDGPSIAGGSVTANAAVQVEPGQSAAPAAATPARPANVEINRPTQSAADLAAAKAAAANAAKSPKPAQPNAPTSGAPLALGSPNFVGDEQGGPGGGWVPPDTDGDVGNNQYTEVTNSDVRVWSLASSPPTQLRHVSVNAHFGRTEEAYFDPTVLYHPIYNRWITLAPQFPNPAGTVQLLSFSVSTSPNAAGGYCTYTIDTTDLYGDGSFFDYPHIGFDHDAFYITANIFNPGFVGASVIIWPLAEMTNCLGMGGSFYTGLSGTLQPPRVTDRNPRSFMLSNQGTRIDKYTVRDSGSFPVEFTGPTSFDIADVSAPPNAPQNVSGNLIDTSDARFVNATAQVGDFAYQVNSILDFGSFAAVRWYKLNTATNAVVKQCTTFATGSSFDFNPSIAANSLGDVFLNWSVTRATGAANIQAWAGGAEATDATATCPTLTKFAYGSGPEYTNGGTSVLRWGDYSSIHLKNNQKRALAVNEIVSASGGTGTGSTWTSKIAQVQFS